MKTKRPDPDFLCCELSEEINEPMIGTAVSVQTWFMLEYRRPWYARATEDNELLPTVQAWLDEQMTAVYGRLQFIRQFQPRDDDAFTLFVSVNDAADPRLYEFRLDAYEDLLDLDVTAVVAGAGQYDAHRVSSPRFFVCANGQRDRSCAIYGAALYRAFAEHAFRHQVWMTTHLGGHRFAPTLLTLPDGMCYGRIQPDDIDTLLKTVARGEIWLEKLRGWTGYDPVAQVAEYHLRQAQGQTRLRFYRHQQTEEMADGRWRVQFQDGYGRTATVTLAAADPLSVYASSGQFKLKTVPQYDLVDIID